jgi:hypothetical protein
MGIGQRGDATDPPRGPGASVLATSRALAKLGDAETVVLVEGITDQVAVETAAAGRGRDLEAERVVILPIGGAHAIGRVLPTLDPRMRLAGLCDRREEELFRRGLAVATRAGLAERGFFVCVDDLEDELIRALGPARTEALIEAHGDLHLFRLFQTQPAWRDRPRTAQLHRFLRSSSRRNIRYVRLLTEATDALPHPLDALLTAIR